MPASALGGCGGVDMVERVVVPMEMERLGLREDTREHK
jgi:hypothetical protein